MREKIRNLVIEAITDTDKLTEIVDKLCFLSDVSFSFSGWIDAKKEQPEEDDNVLMYNGNHIALGYYTKNHKIEKDNSITALPREWKYSNSSLDWEILYWMPLPDTSALANES